MRLSAWWMTLAIALGGCDAPAEEPTPRGPSAPRDEPSAPAPRGPAGPDDACARRLEEGTPAEVRATLTEIGYDAMFADTCLMARAERTGDASACETLTMASLRDRCRERVAIAGGHPLDCPPSRTLAGRDPVCVALAARDRRLCAAAGVIERAVCETALGRDEACGRLPEIAQDECARRGALLAAHVPSGEVRTTPHLAPAASLVLGDDAPLAVTSADRGARIEMRACVPTLVLGDETALSSPFSPGGIALVVALHGEPPYEAALGTAIGADANATLELGTRTLRHAHAASGTVTITRLDPSELGSVVEGSFHAVLSGTGNAVEGTFTSFLRDLDPRPEACPPDIAPEPGAAQ